MFNIIIFLIGLFFGSAITYSLIDSKISGFSEFYDLFYDALERIHQKSIKCPYNVDFAPFLEDIRSDALFKYIQYYGCFDVGNKNIAELRFEIQGLSERYKEDTATVEAILNSKLRDFFIMRVPASYRPYFFVSLLSPQTSSVIITIGRNAFGNRLLEEWALELKQNDRPNDKDLIDD